VQAVTSLFLVGKQNGHVICLTRSGEQLARFCLSGEKSVQIIWKD